MFRFRCLHNLLGVPHSRKDRRRLAAPTRKMRTALPVRRFVSRLPLYLEELEDRTLLSPYPLLAGMEFQVQEPTPLKWGEQIHVNYQIYNGDAPPPVPESFNVGFYISADSTIDKSDTLIGAATLPVPGRGVTLSETAALTLPTVNPVSGSGPFYLGMIIDPDDQLTLLNRDLTSNRGDGLDREMVSIRTPPGLPTAQTLLNNLNQYSYSRAPSDQGQPMILLDPSQGGGYGWVDDYGGYITLNENDTGQNDSLVAPYSINSIGLSYGANSSSIGANGYFQLGLSTPGVPLSQQPREIPGQLINTVRFYVNTTDSIGRVFGVNVYTASTPGEKPTAPVLPTQWFTAQYNQWTDFSITLPTPVSPQNFWAVQFIMNRDRDSSGGTIEVGYVRLDTNIADPLRVAQSYVAEPEDAYTYIITTDPSGNHHISTTTPDPSTTDWRNLNIYSQRGFLYDQANNITALLASNTTDAVAAARDMADAILATLNLSGSHYNELWSGHVLQGDGQPRPLIAQNQTLGDEAFMGLAFLNLYQATGDTRYLNAAQGISDWAEQFKDTVDPKGGYFGGFDPNGARLTFKSLEGNTDLFELDRRLAALGDADSSVDMARASFAANFILDLYNPAQGNFYTGTDKNGNIDKTNPDFALDAQVYPYLTLAQWPEYAGMKSTIASAVDYALHYLGTTDPNYPGNYSFSSIDQSRAGVWVEGDLDLVAAEVARGDIAEAGMIFEQVIKITGAAQTQPGTQYQYNPGLIPATPDGVTDNTIGNTIGTTWDPWVPSLAPTSFFVLETLGFNQFSILPNAQGSVPPGGSGALRVNIAAPNTVSNDQPSIVNVTYTNTGNAPLPAPLLVLTATRNGQQGAFLSLDSALAGLSYSGNTTPGGFSSSVQFLASGATSGVLQPGESETVPVYYAGWVSSQSGPAVNFSISELDPTNTQTIDWGSLKDSLRPSSINAAAWDAIYPTFTAQMGSTWGQFVQTLARDARYLAGLGQPTSDASSLISFEIEKANDAYTTPTLTSVTAVNLPAPGMDLTFVQSFQQSISGRYTLGILGYGWTTNWDISGTTMANGDVVFADAGVMSYFTLRPDGSYAPPAGDQNMTLTLNNGAYRLDDRNGTTYQFNTNGTLNSVRDIHGNTITAAYNPNDLTQLISLTHSNGESITLSYNSNGTLKQLTDSTGQIEKYSYDSTGQFLTGYTDAYGTTSYIYQHNALTSITNPAGTQLNFVYDSQGRLIEQYYGTASAKIEDETWTYPNSGGFAVTDAGGYIVADADGNQTTVFFNLDGAVAETIDALGNITRSYFDNNLNLVKVINPEGRDYTYTYDAYNNRLSETGPNGTTSYTYDGNNNLASYTDPNNNKTLYAYDSTSDLMSITYPDGTKQDYNNYDPEGQAMQYVNGRSQPIAYTYNPQGLVATETFAEKSSYSYQYNALGELTSATSTDATGKNVQTTTFQYQNPNPYLLTEVDYPDGSKLFFQYNAIGQRTQSKDQTGFIINYSYDTVGRLSELTDAKGNLIVHYIYDSAGRLKEKDNGNGTFTVYTYDGDGHVLSITNYAPSTGSTPYLPSNSTVNSFDTYTYDFLGNVLTDTNQDGQWGYAYDADSQLTGAIFTLNSTNPDKLSAQTISYAYDAAGNRVSETVNGVTTTYKVNDRNEYTSSTTDGATTTYLYDADGNLITQTTPSGTTDYTFNALNELTKETGPNLTATYNYDPLGNRVSQTVNGVTTNFEIDPAGLGNVVATTDGTGSLTARYTYGLGLVSQINLDGIASYYDFNNIGSTIDMTGANGNYINKYAYLPFGQTTTITAGASNPFVFVGQFGVQDNGTVLLNMRARSYDPTTGQFTSRDPIGLASGDSNLQRYAFNNPVNLVDPQGTGGPSPIKPITPITRPIKPRNPTEHNPNQPNEDEEKKNPQQFSPFFPLILTPEVLEELLLILAAVGYEPTPNGSVAMSDDNLSSLVASAGNSDFAFDGSWVSENSITTELDLQPVIDLAASNLIPFDNLTLKTVAILGPNSLVTSGNGSNNFITNTTPLVNELIYLINPTGAATDTSNVKITLDSGLDSTSLTWLYVSVLNTESNAQSSIPLAGGGSFNFSGDVPGASNDPFNFNGTLTGQTVSIDASTGSPPPGQLPIGQAASLQGGSGDPPPIEVFVFFTVLPKSSDPTGTVITNQAAITDGGNPPVTTPILKNTIDAGPPTSSVDPLPALTNTTSFPVSWSGQDVPGGSGIAFYNVYVSDEGGPFTPFVLGTTSTSQTFTGQDGHSYAFYSVATDNVGNQQPIPTSAQASTTIETTTPSSTVTTLPDYSPATFFVSWSGSPAKGAPIASYDVYVSDNGGLFTLWQSATSQISATFNNGVNGHKYSFYSVATDTLGNVQPTPTVAEATTTVDTAVPTSTVNPLPTVSPSTPFTVSWNGTDSPGASDIAGFTIFVSDDGGPFTPWLTTPQRSAVYPGVNGHTYSFYSVAMNKAGTLQVTPTGAQVTTLVLLSPTPPPSPPPPTLSAALSEGIPALLQGISVLGELPQLLSSAGSLTAATDLLSSAFDLFGDERSLYVDVILGDIQQLLGLGASPQAQQLAATIASLVDAMQANPLFDRV